MAVLAGLFGHPAEQQPQDSDKLLNLFWNRTELKKEFASLRKEQYRLSDKIKQQEGEIATAARKLANLESMLMNPDWGRNALVHYQLRGLAQGCENKLAKFAEQLKQQRESKLRNRVLVAWNEERLKQRAMFERSIAEVQLEAQELEIQLHEEEARLDSMPGIMKMFRRRSINAKLDNLRRKLGVIGQDENELQARIESLKNQRPPDNNGLDNESKRSINLMIISFAQHLFLQLGDVDFATMVKGTMDRGAESVDYGSAADCGQMIERIRKRGEALEHGKDIGPELKVRADLLAGKATFGSEQDVVPSPASVSTIYKIDGDGSFSEIKGSILSENFWGIARVLSR